MEAKITQPHTQQNTNNEQKTQQPKPHTNDRSYFIHALLPIFGFTT